jgi:hypothetical protein
MADFHLLLEIPRDPDTHRLPLRALLPDLLLHARSSAPVVGGERQEAAFAAVAEYIARNPERAKLISPDEYRQYRLTGCLVPGYPDLSPWQDNYWDRFWKLHSHLCQHGLSIGAIEGK